MASFHRIDVLLAVASSALGLIQIDVGPSSLPAKTSTNGVAPSAKEFLLGRNLGPYTVLRTVERRPLMLDFHVERLLQGRAHVTGDDAGLNSTPSDAALAARLRSSLIQVVEAGLAYHPATEVMCTVLLDAVSRVHHLCC